MREPDYNNNISSPVKTHEEILELIEEIKEFENRFPDFDRGGKWETIEPEITVTEQKPIPIKTEEYEKKSRKHIFFRIKRRSKSEVPKLKRERKATTIKLRIGEEGKLVNTDIRKTKPKKAKEDKPKFNIRKILSRKKEETSETLREQKSEEDKRISLSKIKNIFGGIGKLKNVIPGRKSKTEEPEKTSEETEETEV